MPVEGLEILLRDEHSKTNTRKIAIQVLENSISIKTVFDVIKKNEKPFSQRAAWILSTLVEIKPHFLNGQYNVLLQLVDQKYHDAVLRSSLKVLSTMKIRDKDMSELFDKSISLIKNKNTAVAIKLWVTTTMFLLKERILQNSLL